MHGEYMWWGKHGNNIVSSCSLASTTVEHERLCFLRSSAAYTRSASASAFAAAPCVHHAFVHARSLLSACAYDRIPCVQQFYIHVFVYISPRGRPRYVMYTCTQCKMYTASSTRARTAKHARAAIRNRLAHAATPGARAFCIGITMSSLVSTLPSLLLLSVVFGTSSLPVTYFGKCFMLCYFVKQKKIQGMFFKQTLGNN